MHPFDTAWCEHHDEKRFGELVFDAAMPSAIRSLDNGELQSLLVALLLEWRTRMQDMQKSRQD
jgi:hypothetical protein